MIVSFLSGRNGADWKSDQLVKGTKYELSRIMDEENAALSQDRPLSLSLC